MHSQMDGYANICTDIHTYIHIVHVYVCVCVCALFSYAGKKCVSWYGFMRHKIQVYISNIYMSSLCSFSFL